MAYAYYSQLTVDKTKVGETDANFAVLINGVYDGTGGEPDLRTVANGGHVQNTASGGASGSLTVPADLVFSPNNDGSSLYDFEIEKYDPATGEIVAWVQCGVDTAADTVFYVVYGDSGVTTSQENVAGTWDANFKGVWHLSEPSGTFYDSTGNMDSASELITNYGEIGKIDGCPEFDGVDDEINFGDVTDFDGLTQLTVEAWGNLDAVTKDYTIAGKIGGGGTSFWFWVDDVAGVSGRTDTYTLYIHDGADAVRLEGATNAAQVDQWQYVVGTFLANDPDGLHLYVDGSEDANSPATSVNCDSIANSAEAFLIGNSGNANTEYNGHLDEVRISSIVRSANYVTTCHNNQSSPSTFYSVGAEQCAFSGDYLYQDMPCHAFYQGRYVALGAWVYAGVANRARVAVSDGVDISYSPYHPGDSAWHWLVTEHHVNVAATRVRTELRIEAGVEINVYFDAVALVQGPVTRHFEPHYDEFIWLDDPITSTDWDGDVHSDEGPTTIDLSATFAGCPPGIKAVLLRLVGNDSGSAANEVWFGVRPVGAGNWALVCRPSGKANDMMAEAYGWVPCGDDGDVEYQIDASGAGTFDAWLQLWGMVLPG